MTATDRGKKIGSNEAATARFSLMSSAVRASSEWSTGKSTVKTPSSRVRDSRYPEFLNTLIIWRFSGSTNARKQVIPVCRAWTVRRASNSEAIPRPWCCVVHHERNLRH